MLYYSLFVLLFVVVSVVAGLMLLLFLCFACCWSHAASVVFCSGWCSFAVIVVTALPLLQHQSPSACGLPGLFLFRWSRSSIHFAGTFRWNFMTNACGRF